MGALRTRPRELRGLDPACAQQWLGELAVLVDAKRQSEAFLAALGAMARFWSYSPTNAWLICPQYPRATRVAGRRTWEKLGRRVQPDATPIRILAPMTARGFPFCVVDVFDVSQTRGRRIRMLKLQLPGETDHVARLEAAAARLGIAVVDTHDDRWLGRSLGGKIEIRAGLSSQERMAVLAHELAHEVLHRDPKNAKRRQKLSRIEREAQAEATAYVVMRAFGLPSPAPTYIAWQGGDGAAVLKALGPVQREVRTILACARLTSREDNLASSALRQRPTSVTATRIAFLR